MGNTAWIPSNVSQKGTKDAKKGTLKFEKKITHLQVVYFVF